MSDVLNVVLKSVLVHGQTSTQASNQVSNHAPIQGKVSNCVINESFFYLFMNEFNEYGKKHMRLIESYACGMNGSSISWNISPASSRLWVRVWTVNQSFYFRLNIWSLCFDFVEQILLIRHRQKKYQKHNINLCH